MKILKLREEYKLILKKIDQLTEILLEIKKQNPLIHHITNYVTANDCANIVLALGGSPIMADCCEEVEEIVSMASALTLNLGTLNEKTANSMIIAGKKANRLKIPVILDPVGVGATQFRREMLKEILEEVEVAVIKGNLTEIKNIYGIREKAKGVDSVNDGIFYEEKKGLAIEVSKKFKCITVITGKEDIITDGGKVYIVENGTPLLAKITGTGCMTASLISTCCSVTENYLLASLLGVLIMGICGELATIENRGLGSFKVKLFDHISNFTKEELKKGRFYEE